MESTAFNISCYEKLFQRFQYLFEPELIKEFCQAGILRSFKQGDILMDIGQKVDHIPLVVSGSLKIMREDKEGKELMLYYLELGDTCAATLNCCTKIIKSTIRALCEEDAEVLFIPAEKMETWMISYKSWRNFVLESFNDRLAEMLTAIDTLAFNNMEERLYKYLKDKAIVNKNPSLAVTHLEIADDLHSSRVVISRLMKKLEQDKKIVQERNKVKVLNFLV